MTFALLTATRFRFSYERDEQVPLTTLNKDLKRNIYPTATREHHIYSNNTDESHIHLSVPQSPYFLTNTMKFMQLVQVFMTLKNGTFLFIAW